MGRSKKTRRKHDRAVAAASRMSRDSGHEARHDNREARRDLRRQRAITQEASETPMLQALEATHSFGGADFAQGRELGKGAFGAVHQLDEVGGEGRLALKTGTTDEGKAELAHEASVLDRLGEHENLVGLAGYDEGVDGEDPSLALEFLGGGDVDSLFEELKKGYEDGSVDHSEYWGTVQHLQRDMLGGLDHMHEEGLVHGDVKPGNAAIGDDGRARLIDFGSTREVGEKKGAATVAVNADPELLQPGSSAHTGQDIYAMGQTAHYMGEGGFAQWVSGPTGRGIVHRHGLLGETVDLGNEQKNSSAYGDFVRGTTTADADRLSAEEALESDFLSDPLLQEEEARAVIQRLNGTAPEQVSKGPARLSKDHATGADRENKADLLWELKQTMRGTRKSLDKDAKKRSKQVKKKPGRAMQRTREAGS